MVGKRLGQYEIVEEVGRGGMGIVYRARQASLNRDVALKVLPSERLASPDALARFQREAMAVARITHPGLVHVIDIGQEHGTHFIAMEYLPGLTLAQRLQRKGPLSYADAARVAVQVAGALGAIHARGLVHRDVKPSNVIVDDQLHAKLTDFGMALLSERSDAQGVTLGAAVGTPLYMSPEQVTARPDIDASSDVYALGIVLFEMLAGRHPWDGATAGEAMVKQVQEDLPPIRRYCGDIPDELEAVLLRCLIKDSTARYADGSALEKELSRALLVIEARRLAAGPVSGDYVPRVTTTGARVAVSAPDRRPLPAPGGLLPIREVWARIADPNRRLRRRVRKLATQAQSARDVYKKIEGEAEDLKRRELYHDDHARLCRSQAQNAIAAADERGAAEAAEKERHHAQLSLECSKSAKDVGRRAEQKRAAYDALRDELNRQADELALLDAEARSAGRPIPSERAAASLGFRVAMGILAGVIVFMACMTLFGVGQAVMTARTFKRLGLETLPPPTRPRPAPAAGAPRSYTNGLLLHFTFDEKEGGIVSDKTGSDHAGRLFGARWVPDGIRGGAVLFNGPDDYLEAPDFDFPEKDAPRSICLCFRLEELYTGATSWLLSYGARGYAQGLLLGIDWQAGRAAICPRESGRTLISEAPIDRPGTWYHLVYTYGGNRRHRLYVNGEDSSGRSELYGRLKTQLSGYFILGAHPADVMPGSVPGMRCRMDEIRVYSRELAPGEVGDLYRDLFAQTQPAGGS